MTNIFGIASLPLSFLTNSYILKKKKKSYEGRSSSEYCRFSHNNSARELVIGRKTHFFTSIHYTSDQLSSTCRVTLHGGFNRQAACIVQNKRALALLFSLHFDFRSFYRRQIICRSLNNNYTFYTFDDTRDLCHSLILQIVQFTL